jgi:hypothetical protein
MRAIGGGAPAQCYYTNIKSRAEMRGHPMNKSFCFFFQKEVLSSVLF